MLVSALAILVACSVFIEELPTSQNNLPQGKWEIVGNDFLGVLELQITPGNEVTGQIYGEPIKGNWDPKSNRIEFTRYRSNLGIQVWTGELKSTVVVKGNGSEASMKFVEFNGTYRSIAGPTYGEADRAYPWNGRLLAENSSDLDQNQAFAGHDKAVTAMAWSNDGATLATGGDDRSIRLWSVSRGVQELQLGDLAPDNYVGPVFCFNSELNRLAVCSMDRLTIRSFPDGKLIREFDPIRSRNPKSSFPPAVYAMAFSPDGKYLATAASTAKEGLPGGMVIIWQGDTGKPLHVFDKLETAAGAVAWSKDGTRLAAGTNGVGGEKPMPGEVIVWNATNGKQEYKVPVKSKSEYGEWASAGDVAFAPDGIHVAFTVTAGSRSNPAGLIIRDAGATIRVLDLSTGKISDSVTGLRSAISRIQFSPDGKLIAGIGQDHFVRIWDSASGQELQSSELAAGITSLAFDPSGKALAVGCKYGRISLVPVQVPGHKRAL